MFSDTKNLVIKKSYADISHYIYSLLVSYAINNPKISLCLPTGQTPLLIYKKLAKSTHEIKKLFNDISLFQMDEYLGVKYNQSFKKYLTETLIKPLKIKEKNTFFIPLAQQNFKNYDAAIDNKGLDLILLGIGKNGHIAFNEPGSSFFSKTRIVELSQTTRDNIKKHINKTQPPKYAATIGIDTIMSAKKIVLMASGKDKAPIIKKFLNEPVNPNLPASVLKLHNNFQLVVDKDAASSIKDFFASHMEILKKIPRGKKIIVVSPHPDDSSISAGGTLSLLSEKNMIFNLIMTAGHRSNIPHKTSIQKAKIRLSEAAAESRVLKLGLITPKLYFYDKNELAKEDFKILNLILNKIKPDIVFLPAPNDLHPTHRLSFLTFFESLKLYFTCNSKPIELLFYETPWNIFNIGDYNLAVPLNKKQLNLKLSAIQKHRSQISRTRYDTIAKNLAEIRGELLSEISGSFGKNQKSKFKYAELFSKLTIK